MEHAGHTTFQISGSLADAQILDTGNGSELAVAIKFPSWFTLQIYASMVAQHQSLDMKDMYDKYWLKVCGNLSFQSYLLHAIYFRLYGYPRILHPRANGHPNHNPNHVHALPGTSSS